MAGFIFSMPIAGPISILITSNALKGRRRFCNLATLGASIPDFFYVSVTVFGLTKLYSFYKPFIPYLLSAGAVFLLHVGYKTFKTEIDLEHLHKKSPLYEKIQKKERGGFYTGFMLNFLNPTLFLGWLASSFVVISFVASLGFNTGGLDKIIDQDVKRFHYIEGKAAEKTRTPSSTRLDPAASADSGAREPGIRTYPEYSPLLLSLCYAVSLSAGSIIWFYYLALFLAKFRHRIKAGTINRIVSGLGIALCLFGVFFGVAAIKMFFK